MEVLNDYSGLFSLIAAVASVVAVWQSHLGSKQMTEMYNDWDRKRKHSKDYDAFAEFQDNGRRK